MQYPWLSSMNVGVPVLDIEHEHLFELLRELGNSIEQRNPSGARVLIEEYISVLEEHFIQEEVSMQQAGYPDADEHIAQHRQCLDLLRRVQAAIKAGVLGEAGDVLAEYNGRYFRDLLRDDNMLARYLRDTEAQAKAG